MLRLNTYFILYSDEVEKSNNFQKFLIVTPRSWREHNFKS